MKKRAPLTFTSEPVAPTISPPLPSQPEEQTRLAANTATRKRAKNEAKPGRDGRQFIAAHVTPEAAKQFKLLVVQRDTTTQDLLTEAINDLFAKYGLSRIA
ncbi:ribbon-helix-helix domain-containing protein [Tautonia marina]|uniref:ribbon-helix-helix domain-containing protein n=1 Tax=Tautonia marina TaxID=2653855 RepID=UPI00126089E1|nr:ribbon-helix-helix domain-containing protein [Tautonia marina]